MGRLVAAGTKKRDGPTANRCVSGGESEQSVGEFVDFRWGGGSSFRVLVSKETSLTFVGCRRDFVDSVF